MHPTFEISPIKRHERITTILSANLKTIRFNIISLAKLVGVKSETSEETEIKTMDAQEFKR